MTQISPKNKWFMLMLITLINLLVVGVIWTVLPVLFSNVANDLDLNLAQIGLIWSMLPVGFVLFALPGGSLGDRFGFRKVIGLGCFIVAIANAMVGISPNFISFLIFTLICGVSLSTVFPNLVKAMGLFFFQSQLGLASGILTAGFGVGGALTTAISISVVLPLVGSWRNILFLYSGICLIAGIVWFLSTRGENTQRKSTEENNIVKIPPFIESITKVFKVRDIWLLAARAFTTLCWGCWTGSRCLAMTSSAFSSA